MANLWLFDIDGVLVHLTKDPETDPHLKAYGKDYQDVLGINISNNIIRSTYGMTAQEMHTHILGQPAVKEWCAQQKKDGKEVSETANIIKNLVEVHSNNFIEVLKGIRSIKPLDCVVDFLKDLRKDYQYTGVVTGNLEEPAQLILKKAGLRDYFDILSCDDGKSKRYELIERAVGIAKEKGYKFEQVIVLGDTTRDIKAAREAASHVKHGICSIAVATGSNTVAELRRESPSELVHDLKNYKMLMGRYK